MQTCATHSRVCAHDVPVQFKRFNISVSYYQVAALLCKDTKFGKTMVIKTAKYSGAYTLGFRIDPPERCIKTMQRVNGLLSVYCIAPVFGIQFEQEEAPYVVLSPPPALFSLSACTLLSFSFLPIIFFPWPFKQRPSVSLRVRHASFGADLAFRIYIFNLQFAMAFFFQATVGRFDCKY